MSGVIQCVKINTSDINVLNTQLKILQVPEDGSQRYIIVDIKPVENGYIVLIKELKL